MASKASRVALARAGPSVRGVLVVVVTLVLKAPRESKARKATKDPLVLALVAPPGLWVERASVVSQARVALRAMLVLQDLRVSLDRMA